MLALTIVSCVTSAPRGQVGRGNIFGTGLLHTVSPARRGPSRFHLIAARRSARRKHALLLAPLLVGLFILAVGHGREAISNASKEKIIAALMDPLSLFADRSPGERRPGALLPTKSGPRERVLSTVRDRAAPADPPGGTDGPVFSALPPAFETNPDFPPGGPYAGPPAYGPPFSNTPFLYPGPPPGGLPPEGTPPGGTPPGTTPPGGTPSGGGPPGTPTEPPTTTPPGTIPIPEPATWPMMILGLIGMIMRARRPI